MFGMLDYRAHKLYWLLTKPFNLIVWLISIVLIVFSIAIGANYYTDPIAQFIAAIVALEVMGIIYFITIKILFWICEKVFFFFIDVVPAEGRSKEDALNVLRMGDNYLLLKKMLTPHDWDYEDTDRYMKAAPLINRMLFGNTMRSNVNETINAVSSYIEEKNLIDLKNNEDVLIAIINDIMSKQSLIYKLWVNPTINSIIIKYIIFIVLFIFYRISVAS